MRQTRLIIAGTIIGSLVAFSVIAATIRIDQVNKTFSQSSLTVKVGDVVEFQNHDDVTHNITVVNSDDDGDDKGLQKPGETITHTFAAAGDYVARCQIHPKMKMTIKVQ